MSAKARAAANIRRWRQDPVAFVRENFHVEPDAWQKRVLEALPHNQRMAMKACKGPGKTCVIAWICWWFLACFSYPKVAATSISADNLADGLWTEMSKWQKLSPFLNAAFKWTATKIYAVDHPEEWWMKARSWAKGSSSEQQANTLAGLHADNIMFVLDEAGGIPDAVMAAAEAALANDHGDGKTCAKLIMAGNPTHSEGPLWRACTTEAALWHVTEITSDPDSPLRTPRVSIEWARAQIQKYGADNPWVLVNVFGKFPPSSINTLLGPDEVQAAIDRHYPLEAYERSQKRIGVDVARFGDDATVLTPRQGLVVFKQVVMRNARTHDIAARIMHSKNKWGSEVEVVDGTGGFGGGVIDAMIQAGAVAHEYQGSGKAMDHRYYNKRAEVWFNMAEWIKRGGKIPNDPELKAELCAPTYTIKDGKLLLEPKDAVKERLGRSPDKADSLSLTFLLPEMAAALPIAQYQSGSGMKSDWNPFR